MDSIVALLKDTPIPTILVVSGIVFLFLALVGNITGKLEMPPARQKWSALVSVLLLAAGLMLYILPLRPQGLQDMSSAPPSLTAATQPAAVVQPLSTQSGSASPVIADGAANPAPEGGEGCLEEIFSGISADRVERFEVGVQDKRFSTNQAKNDPAGIVLVELGRPVVALTFIIFEEDNLFKVGSVVDAACQPVEYANSSRGGARDVLQNWDSLEVTTGTGVYSMRFGYFDGMVELDTRNIQE